MISKSYIKDLRLPKGATVSLDLPIFSSTHRYQHSKRQSKHPESHIHQRKSAFSAEAQKVYRASMEYVRLALHHRVKITEFEQRWGLEVKRAREHLRYGSTLRRSESGRYFQTCNCKQRSCRKKCRKERHRHEAEE